MPQPLSEYFALEAGEYLDQLDTLLARGDLADPQALFRLARGVRGSAQIAGAQGIAGVAERLEEAARAIREGRLAWSEELRQRAIRTVDDIRVLMRSHGRWSAADDARAREAAARWGEGGRRSEGVAEGGDQLFAFVRREIAGVVTELDRARGELAESPAGREPILVVLRRMRPVRGVAGLSVLAPVLEVLEGIEELAQQVVSRSIPITAEHLELLAAARDALDAAGQVLERGEAPGVSPELERFRAARDREGGAGGEAGVVPVTSLFHDDGGPHLVASRLAPVPPGAGETVPAEVEAFFRIEATGFLDRAEALIGEAPGGAPGFARTARQLAELVEGVRDLAATYAMSSVARAADGIAGRLRTVGDGEAAGDALADLRDAIPGVPPRSRPAPAASVATSPSGAAAVSGDASPPSVASAQAGVPAADEAGVVPIESLLYAPQDALREALTLRARVEELLGAAAQRGGRAGEVIDELFALVELGLNGPRAAEG